MYKRNDFFIFRVYEIHIHRRHRYPPAAIADWASTDTINQNDTCSRPLRANICRASAGVATSSDSNSRIELMFVTWAALDEANWPFLMNRLSSSPTRTLPPMIAAIVTSPIWCRPAPSTDQT